VPDEPLPREQAREAIRAGKLPSRCRDRMFGEPGSGQPCVVCSKPLTRDEMMVELEFHRHGVTPGLDRYHLHHRCFAAWEFERTKIDGASI
jgi:hypothetical protein